MVHNEAVKTENHLPTWMVLVGAAVAVVGVGLMMKASVDRPFMVERADVTGHWGLGLLIAGGVIAVLGVLAMAVRRS